MFSLFFDVFLCLFNNFFCFFSLFYYLFFLDSLASDSIWCWSKLLLLILSVSFFLSWWCWNKNGNLHFHTYYYSVCVDLFVYAKCDGVLFKLLRSNFLRRLNLDTIFDLGLCLSAVFSCNQFVLRVFLFCCLNWKKFFGLEKKILTIFIAI